MRENKNEVQSEPAGGERAVVVRASREVDVEAMLAIYRHHIRRGLEEGLDDNGALQPDDLRDRRKNLRDHRFPELSRLMLKLRSGVADLEPIGSGC